jgi:hypothetical protein
VGLGNSLKLNLSCLTTFLQGILISMLCIEPEEDKSESNQGFWQLCTFHIQWVYSFSAEAYETAIKIAVHLFSYALFTYASPACLACT